MFNKNNLSDIDSMNMTYLLITSIWRQIYVKSHERVRHAHEHIMLFHTRKNEPSGGMIKVLAHKFNNREVYRQLRASAWHTLIG